VLTELLDRQYLEGLGVPAHRDNESGFLIGGELSDEVLSFCDIRTHNCVLIPVMTGKYRTSLTHLNDTGFTFDQIADVIEYFWEEL